MSQLTMALTGSTVHKVSNSLFRVQSSSVPGIWYEVAIEGPQPRCTCKSRYACRHIGDVIRYLQLLSKPEEVIESLMEKMGQPLPELERKVLYASPTLGDAWVSMKEGAADICYQNVHGFLKSMSFDNPLDGDCILVIGLNGDYHYSLRMSAFSHHAKQLIAALSELTKEDLSAPLTLSLGIGPDEELTLEARLDEETLSTEYDEQTDFNQLSRQILQLLK